MAAYKEPSFQERTALAQKARAHLHGGLTWHGVRGDPEVRLPVMPCAADHP